LVAITSQILLITEYPMG